MKIVLAQSHEDEFELGNRCYNMPAQPGMVLMPPVKGEEVLKPEDQTTLRSGVGKLCIAVAVFKARHCTRSMRLGAVHVMQELKDA